MSLEKKVKKMALSIILEHDRLLLTAFYTALESEGYGKKRMNRIIENMNKNLPQELQLKAID